MFVQEPFWERINKVRNNELGILWKSFIIDATNGWAARPPCRRHACP